jgi:hypothetical protein
MLPNFCNAKFTESWSSGVLGNAKLNEWFPIGGIDLDPSLEAKM